MVAMLVVFHTAVVVIAVQAAEWKLAVNVILRFHLFSVVAYGSDEFMNLKFGDFLRIVNNFQILGSHIPGSRFNSAFVQGSLDALFAHAAVAKHFDVSFNRLALRK